MSYKAKNLDFRDMDVLFTQKIKIETKIWIMDVAKANDHIQNKIMIPNPSQNPPVFSRAPNQDFKDMEVLCIIKIKIESQHLELGFTKNQWPYPIQDLDDKSQSDLPVSSRTPNQKSKEMDVLFTFQIMIETLRTNV